MPFLAAMTSGSPAAGQRAATDFLSRVHPIRHQVPVRKSQVHHALCDMLTSILQPLVENDVPRCCHWHVNSDPEFILLLPRSFFARSHAAMHAEDRSEGEWNWTCELGLPGSQPAYAAPSSASPLPHANLLSHILTPTQIHLAWSSMINIQSLAMMILGILLSACDALCSVLGLQPGMLFP